MKIKVPAQFKTDFDDNGRVCTACLIYKPWEEFKKHSRSATGHSSKCKKCYKESRKAVGRTKELYSAKKRRLTIKKTDPFRWKATNIRGSLLRRSTDPVIKASTPTREEIEQWLHNQEPLICFYSKEPLKILQINIDHKIPINRGGNNAFTNLAVTSHHMNTAKGTMTDTEFISLLKLISTWEDGGKKLLIRLKQGHF